MRSTGSRSVRTPPRRTAQHNLTGMPLRAAASPRRTYQGELGINHGFGGPFCRTASGLDFAARYNVNSGVRGGALREREPQQSRCLDVRTRHHAPVANEQRQPDAQLRTHVAGDTSEQDRITSSTFTYCFCPSPPPGHDCQEASSHADYPEQRLIAGDWTCRPRSGCCST